MIAEYSDQQATGGGTSYLTADHLGTPRVITRANGTISGRHDYQPFGEEIPASYGGRETVEGYPPSDTLRQQYTQKERDVETGLDYFLARYYSSPQGRFVSVDPDNAGADIEHPQTWNGYAYGLNNPITFKDPDGLMVVICDMQGACTTLSDEDANKYTFNRKYQRENGFWVRKGKIYDSDGNQIGTYQNTCCDWAANEQTIRALQDDRTWERAAVASIWNYTVGRLLRSIFGRRPSSGTSSNTPGLPKSAPKPLGRGSTGRATPNNLKEQVAMEQAMSNPAAGTQITRITMNDARWPASQGWVKMRQNVNGVEIHYVRNIQTGEVDDFKFND